MVTLDGLTPAFRAVAERLLLNLRDIEPMRVIYTLRTEAEQADCIRRGVSWTMKSKHLPQPPDGLSHAIDICPVRLLVEKNWAPLDPVWGIMGTEGKALGLAWGGDWKKNPDRPHFEWKAT